jgi:hypothetical protein
MEVEITFTMGSPINDVTVLGGQGFCDNNTNASEIKIAAMGEEGVKKMSKFA